MLGRTTGGTLRLEADTAVAERSKQGPFRAFVQRPPSAAEEIQTGFPFPVSRSDKSDTETIVS